MARVHRAYPARERSPMTRSPRESRGTSPLRRPSQSGTRFGPPHPPRTTHAHTGRFRPSDWLDLTVGGTWRSRPDGARGRGQKPAGVGAVPLGLVSEMRRGPGSGDARFGAGGTGIALGCAESTLRRLGAARLGVGRGLG